uniref:Uncharacterized protein n=1 Tax=Hippocampus comes TaxID=109280 RepID=A0A3Q2YTH0_HIPCM
MSGKSTGGGWLASHLHYVYTSTSGSENKSDLVPIEILWWKLKKMVHDMAPNCKADVTKAIRSMPLTLPRVEKDGEDQ